eukprot:s3256_g8.t1
MCIAFVPKRLNKSRGENHRATVFYHVLIEHAMGRLKGIVEVHLEPAEINELAKQIIENMPEQHKGAVSVDATNLFGNFATKSTLSFALGDVVFLPMLPTICPCSQTPVPHLGKQFSKDTSIQEFAWALQPLATAVSSQPIHQNSLFGIVEKLIPGSPEGMVWLAVNQGSVEKDVQEKPKTAASMRADILRDLKDKVTATLEKGEIPPADPARLALRAKAKAASAAKAVAKAEGKSKAKATRENPDAKPSYTVRKHKRKVADGHVMIFAINSTQTGKQVCQLTESVCKDAENVVTGMVARLNEGNITLSDAVSEMNQLKGTA